MWKKLLGCVLALVMACGALNGPALADSYDGYGDLDGSRQVDASDALYVLKAAVGKLYLSDEAFAYADVNGDIVLDASDALLILKKAVGKLTAFPAAVRSRANDILKAWIFENGTTEGNYVSFDYWTDENVCYEVSYNANADQVYIASSFVIDGVFFWSTVHMDCLFYNTSIKIKNTGYVTNQMYGYLPAGFTDRSPITYLEYEGEYDPDYIEWSRTSVCDLLDYLSLFLDAYDVGLTLADFGFTAY